MLKVAVIGAGHIGARHAKYFVSHPQARLVAICDQDAARVEPLARQFGAKPYGDVAQMLEQEKLDAASICTSGVESGSHHFAPAMQCLEAGVHVLCEKPISNDIHEARQMVEAARRHKVLLGVDLNHRFTPGAARLKQMQTDGVLGKTLFLNMELRISNATEKWPYHHFRALHPHSIDVMRFFGGDITRVQCFATRAPDRMVWSTLSLNLQFKSGAIGHLSGSWDGAMQHGIERLEIGASKGRAILYNLNERLEWMPRDASEKILTVQSISGGMTSFEQTFETRINKFVEQVAAGEPLEASGKDGLAAQEVIEAAIRSHENRSVEEVVEV